MDKLDILLETIAKKHLFIPTLKERNMDSLDFYDVSVSSIKSALKEAYEHGLEHGLFPRG